MGPKGEPPKIAIGALDDLDPDTFDWQAYRGTYKGRALITRLAAIPTLVLSSEGRPSPKALALARAAALQAIPVVKAETWDTALYARLCRQIEATLQPGITYDESMEVDEGDGRAGPESEGGRDMQWIAETQAAAKQEHQRLQVELNGYLSNLIKESIRLSYLSLAELAIKTGQLAEALKYYTQMREYSSGPAHQVQLGLGILEAALMFNDTTPLAGNISKVDASLDRLHPVTSSQVQVNEDMTATQLAASRESVARSQAVRRSVTAKLRVSRAILSLSDGAYQVAVRELANVDDEGGLGDWEGAAISSADAAFIAAMGALASQSRSYIRRVLLDRGSFRAALSDRPWVIDLVSAFVDARYGAALDLVRQAQPHMLLNPWLAPHAADLAQKIRTRALVQYLEPFASVRVAAMADAFATSEDDMMRELCTLAEQGTVDVRIDAVDRLVTIRESDPRADAFRTGTKTGEEIANIVQTSLFRMRLKEAGVIVDPTPPQAKETRKEWWREHGGERPREREQRGHGHSGVGHSGVSHSMGSGSLTLPPLSSQ